MKRPKCDRCLYFQMQCNDNTPCSYFHSLDENEQFDIEDRINNDDDYEEFIKAWLVYASEYSDNNFT